MDKEALIDKIRNLEGLTNDDKADLIGLLRVHKKYGLVWEEKTEDVEERLRDRLPLLTEVKERAIISKDADAPNHILIEGDNLEALTALSYTHEGKIDVIYIDPPYNTGNKDFVYNDSYVDSEDSYRHSKWLSFMHKRLKIAKQLLSDKGVIFISIDDNEQAQLKMLCYEIFGNREFLQQIIIESNPRGSQSSKYFANTHEYLFVFSKFSNPEISFGLQKGEDELSEYPFEDSKGRYRLLGLRQRGGAWRKEDRPMLHYPIYINPQTKEVSTEKSDLFCIEVIPQRPTGELGRWTWSSQKLKNQSNEVVGILVNEGSDKQKWDIARKNYLETESGEIRTTKVKSLWIEKEINYQNGGTEVKEIIGDGLFSYPKPLFLLNKILNCSTNRRSIILDFFAGSGTTLHATMQLNKEDGGKRQCILVTNNENNICEEVTYERNKRVINGYTTPKGIEVEGLKNNSLRYYRTELMERESNHRNRMELMKAATDLLCIKENIYREERIECQGKTLRKEIARLFTDGNKRMMLIYEPEAIAYIVEYIKQNKPEESIKIYVFSDGQYAFDDDFNEVIEQVELCALPDAIYKAYNKVLPKPHDAMLEKVDLDAEELIETLNEANNYSYRAEKGDEV